MNNAQSARASTWYINVFSFLMLLAIVSGAWAADPAPVPATQPLSALGKAKIAMQGKDYAQAIKEIDTYLLLKPKDSAEAQYLKALALHYDGKYAPSIEAAQVVLDGFKDSPWMRKALFLKGQSLIQMKKYKESEEIFEAEALRLLGETRKKEIAGVIVQFADALSKKPAPTDIGALPANYPKAHELYGRVLGMEIGRELKDEVMFKAARMSQLANDAAAAMNEYQAYLREFDPEWTGPVGSQERTLNQKKQSPAPAGKRFIEARYRLAEAQLASGMHLPARQEVEDLRKLMSANLDAPKDIAAGDVAWLLVRTYNMPSPGNLLERAIAATRDFTAKFPKHPNSVEAAWWIAEAYREAGRADQAIAAYQEFIDGKGYSLPDGADATKRYEGRDKSPAELKDEFTKAAVYQIAQIRFNQKEYAKAIEQWQMYVSRYPNGPQWANSQIEIINAEFQTALESVAAKKYDEARKQFEAFLEKHPLDARISQILFIYGQIHYAAAQKLEEDKAPAAKINEEYQKAIDEWSKLVSRFANSDQSSLAQYRMGQIYEEKFGDLEKAIEAYRKLNWGPSASTASGRVTVMTQKHLALSTEHVFRTNEPVKLKLSTRNIEKLTVKMYRLDLESYFRKAHGIAAVESLDIALIQPDKTWELKIDKYAKYKPIEQELAVPFEGDRPGVCVINVSEDDLECTTLVMRSDIDLILKSSRRESLVFVQDVLKNTGAEGVDLLFSDGQKIFATGKTGKDGVFRAKFDQLKDINTLRVFAVRGSGDVRERHSAANMLVMNGLSVSRGLSPKGYLYTDRPAYRPGQPVFIGGVIRHVKDGSYVVPKDQPYLVNITDPSGKLLWEEEKKLSDFGTVDARMVLDEAAAVGQYTITARQKLEAGSLAAPLIFTGQFTVQQFQTEKMRLKLAPARQVYFRGESIELNITAEYYWGAPVAQKQVRYHLPDGREFAEKTDDKGKLKVTFDTTGMTPGSALPFSASVEGENVAATTTVFLAEVGFNIAITTQQPLYLSGEPFEVTVKTTTPDGKPTEGQVNLMVLRRPIIKPDPVLAGVPWVSVAAKPAAEQTVSEQTIKTDAKTGIGTAKLTLEAGGMYVLRATGKDRFDQVVTGENVVTISDASDDIKLRFFSETDTLKVGAKATLRLHSRLDQALALLTFEGEDILDYRILKLKKDYNDVDLNINHEHFPNFTISAAAMDSKYLRYAAKSFTVQRELKVTVKPAKEVYAPGEDAKVEITVTDQLGKPVKAEMSLAMVDEALLAVFADSTPSILDFFQADARRTGEFRIATSAGFAYAGTTRNVVKAFAEEADRMARGEDEVKRINELREKLQKEVEVRALQQQLNLANTSFDMQTDANQAINVGNTSGGFGRGRGNQGALVRGGNGAMTLNGETSNFGNITLNGNFANSYNNTIVVNGGTLQLGGQVLNSSDGTALAPYGVPAGGGQNLGIQNGMAFQNSIDFRSGRMQPGQAEQFQPQHGAQLFSRTPQSTPTPFDPQSPDKPTDAFFFADGGLALTGAAKPARPEVPEAGFWAPAIVTDAKGKATVTVPMPDSTTAWRLTSRGCTVETLVGEATANLTTRKEFFVEIKSPASLQEGDKVRILARVHNLGDYEGPVDLTLSITGSGDSAKEIASLKKTVQVKKNSSSETLFDAVEIPAAMRLNLQIDAKAGKLADKLTRILNVRPWGLEFAAAAGGTATSDAAATVELPADRPYQSQWMTISVGPSMQRAILDLAMGGHGILPMSKSAVILQAPASFGPSAGSELLGVISALEYAKTVDAPKADYTRLLDRARALVSGLVAAQQADGGWTWLTRGTNSNWAASATSFWALTRARQSGIAVNDATLANAQAYLQNQFTKAAANDNDAKAVILHALSVAGAADFANLNRLYRERNILTDTALAYSALALANLNRNEIATELLDLLATRAKVRNADGRALMNWEAARSHAWLADPIETSAVALLAIVKVKPTSDKAKSIAEYLLHERGCYGYPLAKSNGPAIAALSAYFAKAKYAAAQYQLTIEVNGKPFKTMDVQGDQPTTLSNVPADLLVKGKNQVTFRLKGRGDFTYAVTLRGFSPQIKDPGTLVELKLKDRQYYHAPLEYRGRAINAASTSPIANAEVGQRISVKLEFAERWRADQYMVIEEPLPAGAVLVDGSVKGSFRQFESSGSKLTFYYAPGDVIETITYQLVGYSTGAYRTLPTVIRDIVTPSRMRIGEPRDLAVLEPGVKSKDPYKWNSAERFALGSAYFNDGLYKDALGYLSELYKADKSYNERDLARMLLWIHTTAEFYDAKQIVAMFEVVRERHPDLVIPFDKILVVGKAYRDIGEFERAWYVFRAVIDASFTNDSSVSAVLQDEGQFLASIDFQEELWREYPDTADVVSSYFALSQLLYQKAPQAHIMAKQERKIALTRGRAQIPSDRVPNRVEMLHQALRLLASFRAFYPDNPLADDAAFSQANALLELKDYTSVVKVTQSAAALYPKSEYASSFQYMSALGYFWQRDYADALKSAEVVANGESKDRDFARYIVGQIFHAQSKPASAIDWYHKVENLYPDAKEAIGYFEQVKIAVDEVNLFKPGQAPELKIRYRNVKEAAVRVYKVDLMKLYLREKNLANITRVNLSGITPEAEMSIKLGDGKDYVEKEVTAKLPIKDEAAYLVIVRGDDLFTSGVVLITPLKIEVQEDLASGRIRANVMDSVKNEYVPEVHVKAIGSADQNFRSGQSDLRGIFVADGLRGKATVIARVGDSRYAFYRGEKWMGASPESGKPAAKQQQEAAPASIDYLQNLKGGNNDIQDKNLRAFDQQRRNTNKGVEVQKAK